MRVWWLFFLISLVHLAHAAIISNYSVDIYIQEDMSAKQMVRIHIFNDGADPITTLNISLPRSATNIVVDGAHYTNTSLYLTNPLYPNHTTMINISFLSHDIVGELPHTKRAVLSVGFPYPTTHFSMRVALPMGFVVYQNPTPAPIFSSDGKHIILEWSKENMTETDIFSALILFNSVVKKEKTIIGIPYKDIHWTVMGVVLAFLFGYFLAAGAMGAIMQKIKHISVGLSHDEEVVLSILSKHGPLTQAALLKNTDFSKAKLSRLLRSMEERGLIKKQIKGKTNIISIK